MELGVILNICFDLQTMTTGEGGMLVFKSKKYLKVSLAYDQNMKII